MTAKLWNASTGAKIRTFSGHTGFVNSIAFSPDGTKVLTGAGWTDNTAKLWDASTGAVIRTFSGHAGEVTSVAFSPDGTKVLTGSSDTTAKLWDASTGTVIRTFSGHTDSVLSVAFSRDGTKVLTGSGDSTARLWNAATGAEIRSFSGHTLEVWSAAFSPDGTKVLTGSSDGTAKLWNASTGGVIRTFSGHTDYVNSVAFSPDGTQVLTGSGDSAARLWNASTGTEIRTFSGHTGGVYSVAFSPDGTKVLTGGDDGLTFLWDSGIAASARKLDKIILVAGGGGYAGNPIAAQTRNLAELAHLTATVRGYTPENIRYLSAFETPAQNPRVDGAASADAITSAVLHWASDARRLTILLLDHGVYDPGIPEWYFLVDGTRSPRNFLTASALDAALNTAQSGADPLPELCVYVDMCYAGGFVKRLSAAPAAMQRIVIASTTSDRLANFGGGDSGALSFTGFFLSSALLGRTLEDCFGAARTTIVALNLPSAAPQTPWLDDDGDRQFTKSDGAVARKHVFGSHPAFGLLPPEITATRATGKLAAPADYQVWLELGPGPVTRAQAVLSSTADFYPGGAPITNIKTYDLAREGVTQRWSGTIPKADLRDDTHYTIVYVAYRDDGFGLEIASEPWVSLLVVSIRAEVPKGRWELYE
jgi:DNA-binding beta-propeller fold protein YncE